MPRHNPKPLTIVALPPCDAWPELEELEAKGHTLIKIDELDADIDIIKHQDLLRADIIIGSNCWRMGSQHKKYLVLAIKEARMLKYPHADQKKARKQLDDILPDDALESAGTESGDRAGVPDEK